MALNAAAGDDLALVAELRTSFVDSLESHIALLSRARCDGNWVLAANRLSSLGASFHAGDVIAFAAEALEGAPGDPVVLRKLRALAQSFSAGN